METKRAIIADRLSKKYPKTDVFALKELSFQVATQEVYGFLGANGAGKSTTIRLLMNFLHPTSGSATIVGLDSVRDSVAIKRHVGYLAGEIALYSKMTGRELLERLGQLQPINHDYFGQLVERFEAELDKPIGKLSKGNRQKIGIIQAFMHQPQVLILDEPTSGLDPLMQEEFYAVVREASKNGSAILVSSHNLAEVQRMCDRVGIIRRGQLITEKSVSEMTSPGLQRFRIDFAHQTPKSITTVPDIKVLAQTDNAVTIEVVGELQPLLEFLAKHKVSRLKTEELDLEEEFLRYYGEEQS